MPGVSQGSWLAGPGRAVGKACGSIHPSLPGQAHPMGRDDFSPDPACTKAKQQSLLKVWLCGSKRRLGVGRHFERSIAQLKTVETILNF